METCLCAGPLPRPRPTLFLPFPGPCWAFALGSDSLPQASWPLVSSLVVSLLLGEAHPPWPPCPDLFYL